MSSSCLLSFQVRSFFCPIWCAFFKLIWLDWRVILPVPSTLTINSPGTDIPLCSLTSFGITTRPLGSISTVFMLNYWARFSLSHLIRFVAPNMEKWDFGAGEGIRTPRSTCTGLDEHRTFARRGLLVGQVAHNLT